MKSILSILTCGCGSSKTSRNLTPTPHLVSDVQTTKAPEPLYGQTSSKVRVA